MSREKTKRPVPDTDSKFSVSRGKKDASLEYRHIELFRHTYRQYSQDGKGVGRDMIRGATMTALDRIKSSFGSAPFDENDGRMLSPSPFGERLFNDSKAVELAMLNLVSRISLIRQSLPLRVSVNHALFRTPVFCRIYRMLDTLDGFRPSFVQSCESAAPGMLEHGECDMHIGFGSKNGDRFLCENIGAMPMRLYIRRPAIERGEDATAASESGIRLSGTQLRVAGGAHQDNLSEKAWMRLLDHPFECMPGTRVHAPEVAADPEYWTERPVSCGDERSMPISVIRLRNHPYENLDALGSMIREHISHVGEA